MEGVNEGASDQQPRVGGYAWYVIGVLLIAWTLAYADRLAISLLIPSLKADLNLSDTQVSLIQGFSFGVFFALAGLPIGRLVDRSNRRNIIAVGVVLWSVMTMLCGMATNFWELFIARMFVGIGEACLAPASYSLLADYFPESKRGRAAGIMGSGQPIGAALSSAVSGTIVQVFAGAMILIPLIGLVAPWQFVFLVFGAPGLLVGLMIFTIREPVRSERVPQSSAVGAAFRKVVSANKRLFGFLYFGFALQYIAAYAFVSWGAVLLMRVNHVPAGDVGAMFASMVFVGVAAHLVAGWLSDVMTKRRPHDGRLRTLLIIMPVTCVVFGLFVIPAGTNVTFAMIVAINFLVGAFSTVTYPSLTDLLPNEMRGMAISIFMLIANTLGLGFSPTLVALVTDYVFGDDMMLRQAMVVVALPCALGATVLLALAQKPYAEMRRRYGLV